MPRFHFNIFNGHGTLDTDGIDLCDFQAARRERVRLAGAVLASEADDFMPGEDWRLEVTDPRGLVLFRLDVNLAQSAAVTKLA